MHLTNYLIFILFLVLEVIGLGFTLPKLSSFLGHKFPRSVHLPVPHQASFIVHIHIPTTLTLLTPSTLLPPPSQNWGPTHLSIPYLLHTHLAIPISTTTEPQSSSLVSPCTSSYSSSSPALLADFPSMGAAFGMIMHWCALTVVPGVERSATLGVFLMSQFLSKKSYYSLFPLLLLA